jgi:MEDS: MEthanogen/methylotroph, DcmR Sensory domain
VNLQVADITDLALQVADHVCAFYNGGNDVDDIVVDCASQGLQAGRRCVSFGDRVSSERDPVPGELITRKRILPFAAEDGIYLRGGALSRDALLGIGEAVVTGALGDGYQRIWALGNMSSVVRSARPEDVLDRALGPDRVHTALPAAPHVPMRP